MRGIKTGGRVAGTPNKITNELREVLKEVAMNELDNIPALLKEVTPECRLQVLVKILYLIVPRVNDDTQAYFDLKQITGMNIM